MGHPGILGKADYISAITRITRSSGTSLRSQQRTSAFLPARRNDRVRGALLAAREVRFSVYL